MVSDRNFSRRQMLAALGLGAVTPTSAFAWTTARPSLVETASGTLRGSTNGALHSFLGIPYAASTGGQHRFLRPRPAQPWGGVRDALRFGPIAPQVAGVAPGPLQQSEDCLNLNVWTPGTDRADKPVMVWLHGGGFARGSSASFTGHEAALAERENLVVVSLNHRLNAFGFLDLVALDVTATESSNLGMLDIVAALEWVRANIAAFGGDPARVMIFGASGGARKVAALMGMPVAQGLFYAAAMEGPGHVGMGERDEGAIMAHRLSQLLELGARDIVSKLRGMPAQTLVSAMTKLAGGARFAPVIDGSLLPAYPLSAGSAGLSARIPLLMGYVRTRADAAQAADEPGLLSEHAVARRLSASFEKDEADGILRSYGRHQGVRTPAGMMYRTELDDWLQSSALQVAAHRNAAGAAPTYLFRLSASAAEPQACRARSADVPCVFSSQQTNAAAAAAGAMARAWSAMARTGKPQGRAMPEWPAYSDVERAVMAFGAEMRIETA